ncbi:MAG: PAS domain S-box protein [Sulfuricella sp.]|nr:PAS domain S-box protein [Sulfuricella sp.]
MRLVVLLLLICGVLPPLAGAELSASPAQKNILMLYSYGDGGKGVEIFRDTFRSVVNDAGISVDHLFLEYLDLERNQENRKYRPQLRDLLLEKYAGRNIGVVITVQQPALDFLLHEGRNLAPAAPAITLQAPAPTLAEAQGRRIVSQLARFDIKGTLERALELFPKTRRVVFVSGSSVADKKLAAEALSVSEPWRDKLEFETTDDLSLEQLLRRVASLPPRTIIVFTQYNRDANGLVTRAYEVEGMLVKAANAPVFGLYDFNLSNGGIGGAVVSVKALGESTGQLALDILNGKRHPNEPVMSLNNPSLPIFNWSQIERWGGDASRLAKGAVFVNRIPTFWEDHWKFAVGAIAIVLLEAVTIAGLMVHRRRRQAAEQLLQESEVRCRTRLDLALEHKRRYEEGLELLLKLNLRSSQMTEKQICDLALDIAVKTTRSGIGYLHLVNDDQNTISLTSWNAQAAKNCTAIPNAHYPLESAGIWADCARMRRPVIHNDYQNMVDKKSCPEGHAHLLRHMSVPVVDGDKVRLIIGVGNKQRDYVDEDAQQLQWVANEVQKIVLKRRAEEALQESEGRFRFIADLSPGLIWVSGESKLGTWFNKTWLDFTGRSMAQEMGNGWTEGVHPEDLERCLAIYSSHFDNRLPFSMEYRLRHYDGAYRWVLDAGQPRFDESGVFKGYVDSCLDITEQRDAEGQLRKLWLAVEQSPSSIMVSDLDSRIEYVNQAFEKISGYRQEEVLGRNPRILHSGETPATTYQQMRNALARGDIWEGEFINRRKNGEIYTEFARISPVRQSDGRITHYLAIKEDITERKRAEDAIREAKTLLQCVIDSTPDWIHVKDREHRFMLVNQSFARAFNQTPEHMVGRFDSDFLPLDMCDGNADRAIPSVHDDDDAIFNGDSIHNPYDKVFFENGEIRVFDTFKGPLRDPLQKVYGNLTYRRDITERYNTEQEQRVLEKQLRQSQKMELIGHLTGGIAHDFNNILAAIFGYAELAQMSPVLKQNPQLSLYLQEILQAGIRAKELVSQLLTFSHKKEAVTEPIIVAPIIKEVTKLLRSTMPATISIKASVAKDLPEALISAVHLHQILMNLGINARDAIVEKGSVEINAKQVVLGGRNTCDSCHQNFSGEYLMLSVKDSGSGIPPENLLKIFDPFFSTKEVGRGSGLGLSVIHGIVHSANGHIRVLSVPGEGAEFRVYLPAQSRASERSVRDLKPDADRVPARGHVLVVDDEASIVGFMTALLEGLGYKVTGLNNPTEALRFFQNDPQAIDLVITDQTMPDMTGAELASAMLARRPDLPIVLSTGYSNAIDEDMARRIGIRRFLMKPVPAKILADVVAECLAKKTDGG